MSTTSLQEITLKINNAVIKLRSGTVINAKAYTSTDRGIYFLINNYATTFGVTGDDTAPFQKLAFVPYEQVEVVLYNVANKDPNADSPIDDTTSNNVQG